METFDGCEMFADDDATEQGGAPELGLQELQENRVGAAEHTLVHITSLPFDAEGWRHCVLILIKSLDDEVVLGCAASSHAEIVLGQACRTLHTWFNTRFDATDLAEASPVARPESVRRASGN